MEHIDEKAINLKSIIVHTVEILVESESNDVDDPESAQLDGANDLRHSDGPSNLATASGVFVAGTEVSFMTTREGSWVSYRSHGADGEIWNQAQVSWFVENTRQALKDAKSKLKQTMTGLRGSSSVFASGLLPAFKQSMLSQNELASYMPSFLRMLYTMISEEGATQTQASIGFIINTRFEKLLAEILVNREVVPDKDVIQQAKKLEELWISRFGSARWHSIEKERLAEMQQIGCFRDLRPVMRREWKINEPFEWTVKNPREGADAEGSLDFIPGDWYLNMYCALRDGMISNPNEMVTKGSSGVTAIALLSGEERESREGPLPYFTEYVIEGSNKAMPFSLLTQKRPVRVLRGMDLKSRYAPEVGIRYDGLYMIKSYSHRLIDNKRNVYQCKLNLERMRVGQRAFDEVFCYPRPSQIDKYMLYWEQVGGYVQKYGIATYKKWITLQNEEKRRRMDWRRELRLSLEYEGQQVEEIRLHG